MNQFSFLISMNKQQRRRGMVAAGLAGVAIMVFTAAAGASPIRFDNPSGEGHFEWFGGSQNDPIGLDVTLPADEQTGAWGDGILSFGQMNNPPTTGHVAAYWNTSGLQVGGDGDYALIGVDAGDPIPSGSAWKGNGEIYYEGYGSQLPEGVPTYLGVYFPVDDGTHYGWIGVVRQNTLELDAFAWGYETEAGVPIAAGAVPEPGTLSLLACGLIGLLCYAWRKRK